MISTLREIIRFIDYPSINLWTIVIFYFWSIWSIKLICSLFYRPVKNNFNIPVSVIVPTYKEDEKVLLECINRVLRYQKDIVSEIVVVTDIREPEITKKLQTKFVEKNNEKNNNGRFRTLISSPGKREAIDLGIRAASNDIIILIDSDTFVDDKTIPEIVKPFIDKKVGGAVSDQHIYNPYGSMVNFFNTLVEGIKYKLTVPALSLFGNVTVLCGRCVAYRKDAVLEVLPDLVNEKFLGKKCISGDDGRLTSLLLKEGWKTVYQSTATVYTVSPPTLLSLIKQRIRWSRNTSRRTLRAIFCWDGIWVWKRPVTVLHMLSNWTNTMMVGLAIYALIISINTGLWFWFGYTYFDTFIRLGVFIIGITLTRLIRISPILRYHSTRKWIYFPLFPWYLIIIWLTRIYAILTMNRQGWVTRKIKGPGGF